MPIPQAVRDSPPPWCVGAVSSWWGESWRVVLKLAPKQRLTHDFQLMACVSYYWLVVLRISTRHSPLPILASHFIGCRNEGDRQRVSELRQLADSLGIADAIEFCLNVSFSELKERLAASTIGLHTMWNEHFGIGKAHFIHNTRYRLFTTSYTWFTCNIIILCHW